MKILLVKPYNLTDHIQPSLGLGYLASSVRNNHETHILDCIKDRIKPSAFSSVLKKRKPDLVGVQCYTYDLHIVRDMLAECRSRGIVTVLGGPQPSAEPIETMDFFEDDADFLFQGEAEKGFSMLVDRLDRKKGADYRDIPGLAWRENGKLPEQGCVSEWLPIS